LQVLAEEGYVFDSSVNPVLRRLSDEPTLRQVKRQRLGASDLHIWVGAFKRRAGEDQESRWGATQIRPRGRDRRDSSGREDVSTALGGRAIPTYACSVSGRNLCLGGSEATARGFLCQKVLEAEIPFAGVIEMSALVDPTEFNGLSLVYLPRYVSSDDPFLEASDESVQEKFLAGLMRMYPSLSREEVVAFRVSRAGYVLPFSTLDYSAGIPPAETSIPGLFLANSAQIVNGTLNVNETVRLAERVVVKLTQGRRTTLPAKGERG
jgi:hypothetical protein